MGRGNISALLLVAPHLPDEARNEDHHDGEKDDSDGSAITHPEAELAERWQRPGVRRALAAGLSAATLALCLQVEREFVAAPSRAVDVRALLHAEAGELVALRGSSGSFAGNLTLPSDLEIVGLVPAILISVIGFVESISVAQTLAAKKRQRIDPDQELIGLGAANIGAGFTGGYPVTGGFARSVVNFDAGAATPAAGAFTAVGLAIAAIALTVWVLAEAISRKAWLHLVAIPATFCIGVSCGLPLYLFLRSRGQ
jgi:hypothetical protein